MLHEFRGFVSESFAIVLEDSDDLLAVGKQRFPDTLAAIERITHDDIVRARVILCTRS